MTNSSMSNQQQQPPTDYSPSALGGPWTQLLGAVKQRYGLGARLYAFVTDDPDVSDLLDQLKSVDSPEHVRLSELATDLFVLDTACQGAGSRIYMATARRGTIVDCKSADLTTLEAKLIDGLQAFRLLPNASVTLYDLQSSTVLMQLGVDAVTGDVDYPAAATLRRPKWAQPMRSVKRGKRVTSIPRRSSVLMFALFIGGSLALATVLVLFYELWTRGASRHLTPVSL
jgi:hypothetical protein